MQTRSRRIVALVLTIVLVPSVVNYVTNYLSWLTTRDRSEITLRLDSWISVGRVSDRSPTQLKLQWDHTTIRNAVKVSWTVWNSGNKGLHEFALPLGVAYPCGCDVISAVVSSTSPGLQMDTSLALLRDSCELRIRSIGIVNPGEYFKLDVFLINTPDSAHEESFLEGWSLRARGLDLAVKTDLAQARQASELQAETTGISHKKLWIGLSLTIALALAMWLSLDASGNSVLKSRELRRVKKTRRDSGTQK